MTQHVYARLIGYGLAVIPRAPFRIEYANDSSRAIDVCYDNAQTQKRARLIPDKGGYQSQLAQGTESLSDVLDIENGPDEATWKIETSIYDCAWPRGYALLSNRFPHDPSPFDLISASRQWLFIRTPSKVPPLDQFVAPGQTIVAIEPDAATPWIEVDYVHQDQSWTQRHYLTDLQGSPVVITMQAPSAVASDAVPAAEELAVSLKVSETVWLDDD